MTLNRPEEALLELEILKEIAPDEANVWFLSGRLCKMLGRKGEAVKAFTVALNLDPKVSLKTSIDLAPFSNISYRLPSLSKTRWKAWMTMRISQMRMGMKIWSETSPRHSAPTLY